MLGSRTISISIERNWAEAYEAIWHPEDFSKWASGLSKAELKREGSVWRALGPEGEVTIRFTGHNAFGVLDHYVQTAGGEVYVPLRIIRNGEGAEVQMTLFRQPGMSDAKFEEDAAWIARDLEALKELLER